MAGKTFPAFPANVQPAFLRIWQEAHEKIFGMITHNKGILFTRGRHNWQINYSTIKCAHIDNKVLVMAVAFRVHTFAMNIEHMIINMKTRVATKYSIQFRNSKFLKKRQIYRNFVNKSLWFTTYNYESVCSWVSEKDALVSGLINLLFHAPQYQWLPVHVPAIAW